MKSLAAVRADRFDATLRRVRAVGVTGNCSQSESILNDILSVAASANSPSSKSKQP